MDKITDYRIQLAQKLYTEIEKESRTLLNPAQMTPTYQNYQADPQNLVQWVKDERDYLLSICDNDSVRMQMKHWTPLSDNDLDNTIIPDIVSFIALTAVEPSPDYSRFTIFENPKVYCDAFFMDYDILDEIHKEFAEKSGIPFKNPKNQNNTVNVNTSSANATGTVNGTPKQQYVAIPAAYVVTGNQSSGDYMEMLAKLGYSFRRNLARDVIEVNGDAITDGKESEILLKMRDNGYKGQNTIKNCINVIADDNAYHPIKDYFNSLSWDGTEVLDNFALLLDSPDPANAGAFFRKWMISVVAKIMEGEPNSMLVLEGGQGKGKSTLAKWLCPLKGYFKEGQIDPKNNDNKISACDMWIWEVGELNSTTKKADVDALKAFLTTREFNYRPPYGHHAITRPALASYIGTVNNSIGFLYDVTGNRRFWTIPTGNIDWDYKTLYNVNDLWAEAYARWKRGDDYSLSINETNELKENQSQYEVVNFTAEAIKKYYLIDPNKKDDPNWQILAYDLREQLKTVGCSNDDVNHVRTGNAITALGISRKRGTHNAVCYCGIRKKP